MSITEKITHNYNIYSVTQLSKELQNEVENKYSYIKIRGEISGFKQAGSGHAYFALKDENNIIDAACWNFNLKKFAVNIEDGLEVICTGKITIYAPRSKYQIIIEDIEISGQGALMLLFEKRKQKLSAEGLFASEHKKNLPKYPEVIGLITSETGAVLQDIIHRIQERFPLKIILWPVTVQGEFAATSIARAIRGFNNKEFWNKNFTKPDVLIIARGGGSIEDLWAFNEEIIVREAYKSEIPIISAIGHETDYTLLDYVADFRAPTPTAAAEIITPNSLDLLEKIKNIEALMISRIKKLLQEKNISSELNYNILNNYLFKIDAYNQKVDELNYKLKNNIMHYYHNISNKQQFYERQLSSPDILIHTKEIELNSLIYRLNKVLVTKIKIEDNGQKILSLKDNLKKIIRNYLDNKSKKLDNLHNLLESYSYQRTLKRGFAIIKDQNNTLISSANHTEKNQEIEVIWHDGKKKAKLIS